MAWYEGTESVACRPAVFEYKLLNTFSSLHVFLTVRDQKSHGDQVSPREYSFLIQSVSERRWSRQVTRAACRLNNRRENHSSQNVHMRFSQTGSENGGPKMTRTLGGSILNVQPVGTVILRPVCMP